MGFTGKSTKNDVHLVHPRHRVRSTGYIFHDVPGTSGETLDGSKMAFDVVARSLDVLVGVCDFFPMSKGDENRKQVTQPRYTCHFHQHHHDHNNSHWNGFLDVMMSLEHIGATSLE